MIRDGGVATAVMQGDLALCVCFWSLVTIDYIDLGLFCVEQTYERLIIKDYCTYWQTRHPL